MKIETVRRLTDNYKKNPESNNGKLLSLANDGLNELLYVFRMIERYRDIDNAKGLTLDRIGKNVSEQRRTEDDEEYRKCIKTRIGINRSDGDIESLGDIAESLLGDSFLGFRETWNIDKYKNEPAGLIIRARNITTAPELKGEPKRLSGDWFINGEYFLNGGYEHLEEYNPLEAIEYIRNALNRAKAGGVRLYWEIPEIAKTNINIAIQQKAWQNIKNRSILAFDIKQGAIFNVNTRHVYDYDILQSPKLKISKEFESYSDIKQYASLDIKNRSVFVFAFEEQSAVSIKNKALDDNLLFSLNGEAGLNGMAKLQGTRPKIVNRVIIKEVAA